MAIRPVPDRVADAAARTAADETARAESARIVSTLIRMTGDFALAEDCLQDALAKALSEWPTVGVPSNPGAWLTTVAKNRAIDLLRRASAESRAVQRMALEPSAPESEVDSVDLLSAGTDDRLTLIFTCCHPALSMDARVALTLRTVAGLTTAEIARMFLVSESTMEKRLVRTRARIRNTGIPYRVPPAGRLVERRDGVLAVLYLLFTAGYSATTGDSVLRRPLLDEAIRLTRVLVELMPDDPEARGLLALMLLQHARSRARVDSAGDLVTLQEQDRSLWDRVALAEGLALVAHRASGAGRYELQARIAACHADAIDAEHTDFERIVLLYDELDALAPSPVVALNRAVAVSLSQGPSVGLALIDSLVAGGALTGLHLLPATRADMLRRLGRAPEAALEYEHARRLAPTDAERRYLDRRLAEVTS